ncbi:Hypothetical protein, putative [Bodo saltans]|uniref:Uncharacterized protein n=1 Tax=Bodo saltans TaxID=75058 RepID=A0A0S4KKV7_BODSA|nr:Hypothetical protein, putative [Bodo saltans]|eukprot:CUI14246.1 Hypothetical protein, putative [Bodo saltans]
MLSLPRRPQPPSGGKKKKSGGIAPRRFNVLSAALGSALSVEELTSRMDLIHVEASARTSLFVEVIAELVAEKIHAAVARHWLSTLASRDYVYALEKKEYDTLVKNHRAQLQILRANVSPEAVALKIVNAQEEELLARKRIVLLEQKMFEDFFRQLGRMLLFMDFDVGTTSGGSSGSSFLRDAVNGAAQEMAAQSPSDRKGGKRVTRLGADGKPLVHLCDGCPFLKPEDCPFYAAPWVSKESFADQHQRRKLARLKAPLRLEQLSYDKLLREREAHVANMNIRMYRTMLLNA